MTWRRGCWWGQKRSQTWWWTGTALTALIDTQLLWWRWRKITFQWVMSGVDPWQVEAGNQTCKTGKLKGSWCLGFGALWVVQQWWGGVDLWQVEAGRPDKQVLGSLGCTAAKSWQRVPSQGLPGRRYQPTKLAGLHGAGLYEHGTLHCFPIQEHFSASCKRLGPPKHVSCWQALSAWEIDFMHRVCWTNHSVEPTIQICIQFVQSVQLNFVFIEDAAFQILWRSHKWPQIKLAVRNETDDEIQWIMWISF